MAERFHGLDDHEVFKDTAYQWIPAFESSLSKRWLVAGIGRRPFAEIL